MRLCARKKAAISPVITSVPMMIGVISVSGSVPPERSTTKPAMPNRVKTTWAAISVARSTRTDALTNGAEIARAISRRMPITSPPTCENGKTSAAASRTSRAQPNSRKVSRMPSGGAALAHAPPSSATVPSE